MVANGEATQVKPTLDSTDSALLDAQKKLVDFYSKELEENTNMLAIGWDKEGRTYFKQGNQWFFSIIGWLITAFAVSLGAPFWFGLLNKLVALRSSGKSGAGEEAVKRTKNQVKKSSEE